jgi:putative ABC transport system permease protein
MLIFILFIEKRKFRIKLKKLLIDIKEGILISFRAIRANKMRAFLTTLGIIIGIVAVTTMSTAIVGLKNAFITSISSFGSDVLYIDKFEWFGGQDWSYYRNRRDITYEQYERLRDKLKDNPDIEAIAPNKRTFGATVERDKYNATTTVVYGTTAEYMETANTIPAEGRFMSDLEVKASRNVCVIGKDIADALFPYGNPINQIIKVNNEPLKVVGVLEKQGSALFGSFSMDGQVIMPIGIFEKIFGAQRRNLRIDVKVANQKDIADVKEEVRAIMRVIRKVPPGKPDDFAINQQEVFKQVYDRTVGVISIAGIVITSLALFVGAIGIMNIMFVSVTERTNEIGVRKAVGAKTWSILIQFLSEAAIICLIGGIIGLVISFPLSLMINQFLPTAMPVSIVVLALIISSGVGVVSGFLPAYKASRLNPVEALRKD